MILPTIKDFFVKHDLENTLLFLVLLFLPTQLGRHFFFDFSFVYSLRVDYLSFIIYFWDLLVILLLITSLIKKPKLEKKSLVVLFIFLFLQGISIVYSEYKGEGLVRLEQYFVIGFFGYYISTRKLGEIKKIALASLSIGILFECALALMQFLSAGSIGFWIFGERDFSITKPLIATFDFYGQVFLRPYATFPHPNVFGAFLVIGMSLMVYFSRKVFIKNKFDYLLTYIVGASILGSFFTTILTFSRLAIVALFVQALVFFRRKLLMLFLLFALVSPFVLIRFNSLLNFDYLSVSRRGELATIATSQFLSQPLFGIGLNGFIPEAAKSNLISGSSRFLQPVHSIYLLTLAETGLFGFVGFLVLISYAVFKLWKNLKTEHSKVFLGCFGIILFLGFFDHYFLTLAQGQRLLFLVWGLALSKVDD